MPEYRPGLGTIEGSGPSNPPIGVPAKPDGHDPEGGGKCEVEVSDGQHLVALIDHRGGGERAQPAPAIVAAGVGIHLKEPVAWLTAAARLARAVARARHPARDSVRVQPCLASIGVEVQRRGGREEVEAGESLRCVPGQEIGCFFPRFLF